MVMVLITVAFQPNHKISPTNSLVIAAEVKTQDTLHTLVQVNGSLYLASRYIS